MEVTDAVWSIVRDLHRAAVLQRRAAGQQRLSPVALGILNLALLSSTRPSMAAAELGVPAPTVTRAVDELAGQGLVRRAEDSSDGRSYAIELTGRGRRELTAFRRRLARDFGRHLDGWADDDVVRFAEQLSRLVDSLARDAAPSRDGSSRRNAWRSARGGRNG